MWYIQDNQTFPVFTTYFHHSKEVFVCSLIVNLRCVFWVGLSIRGGGIDSPRPASQRAAAFILTAAMLTTLAAPAFAGTWDIENGDITISAGETGNDVTQNNETTYGDTGTVITGKSGKNTVTINAEDKNDKVEVTLKDVNIDASSTGSAAVSVTGKGDTNIELDGDNELKSGADHAGLEHNKTDTSGKLTIQDKNKNGSLDATGGLHGAGIGGGNAQNGQVTITGGDITATAGSTAGIHQTLGGGAGIGGGDGGAGKGGNGDVEITGGTITATGVYGAGIGGGRSADGDVTISGGTIKKATSVFPDNASQPGGAGIGGGYAGNGNIIIKDDAVVEEVQGGEGSAGIGSGCYGATSEIEISGNAKIENVTGGYGGAGIGGGFSDPWSDGELTGNGKVTIKDNAVIHNAQGGAYGAGIGGGDGGGYAGLGDVTIEGNTTVNATGGVGAAGIGSGVNSVNDAAGNGNQITIRSNESGAPTVNATGGESGIDEETDEETEKKIPGGAGIGSGAGDAKANITLEGKVTITATAGKDNVAIGDMNGEQEFNGLAEGSSITRYDSKGNDTTLPTDPGYPVPADTSSSGGGSATSSAPASPLPGLTVTDKDGQRISYTSTQSGNTLTVCVGRFTASFRISLAALRQLRAEGIETITFQTILCSTTLSVDELLAMGGEDAEVVLTHHIRSSTLTVGGKAV